MNVTATDWATLGDLVDRVKLPSERAGVLCRRIEHGSRPGSPYQLLVGRPGGGLELLLGRWVGLAAAEALEKAAGQPLVLGLAPDTVRPALGAWPTHAWSGGPPGHLIALRTTGVLSAGLAGQIATLGHLDLVVWVTRLSQALNETEREQLRGFAALAATARVLVVGLAGEEASEADLAEVTAFATARARQAGFGARCLGTAVWFPGTSATRPGALADPGPFVAADPAAAAVGKDEMMRRALADLLVEVCRRAEESPPQAALPVEEAEAQRLTRELAGYLADLGRELARHAAGPRPATDEALRSYALAALRGWGAYTSIEGHWMKYVERLRLGIQEAFLAEAQEALAGLEAPPAPAPCPLTEPLPAAEPGEPTWVDRAILEAKRVVVGLVCGLAAALAAGALLGRVEAAPGLSTVVSYACLVLGSVLGYAAGRRLIASPRLSSRPPEIPDSPPPALEAVRGWNQVERRLTGWFAGRIAAQPAAVADECRRLAARLGIEDERLAPAAAILPSNGFSRFASPCP